MGPTSLKPRQKKRKYGPVQVMMAAFKGTGSRDGFQKYSTKMDRSIGIKKVHGRLHSFSEDPVVTQKNLNALRLIRKIRQ
jgi:hypothetical protein